MINACCTSPNCWNLVKHFFKYKIPCCEAHYKQLRRKKELQPLSMRKKYPNRIEVVGKEARIYLKNRYGQETGEFATIDSDKVELVSAFTWNKGGKEKAVRTIIEGKKEVHLHRLINKYAVMEQRHKERELIIYHINGDKLDNREINFKYKLIRKYAKHSNRKKKL